MRSSSLLLACVAGTALAAAQSSVDEKTFGSWSAPLARFYQEVDKTIAEAKKSPDYPKPPPCDMSKVSMPVAPTPLPAPDPNTFLSHIALGRGVQNYTCPDSSPSSTPTAIGAVASLYNISCTQSNYPALSTMITNLVTNYPLPSDPNANFQPSDIVLSGHHFFSNATPVFDLDVNSQAQYGYVMAKKDSSSPAPKDAPVGPNGELAVPWLKLNTIDGTTGGIKHVYRLNTVGGTAPKSCEGMTPGVFTIVYSAQYWFYAESQS